MRSRRRKPLKSRFIPFVFAGISTFLVATFLYLAGDVLNSSKNITINEAKSSENTARPSKKASKYVKCIIGDETYHMERVNCIKMIEEIQEEMRQLEENTGQREESYEANVANDDQEWGETIKLDENISVSKFLGSDRMATVGELNEAISDYRRVRGLPGIANDTDICEIANRRANDQLENGGLDNHAGFDAQFQGQDRFFRMGEVLFGGNQPVSAVQIVEWGWDKSLTGHKEAISDPSWTDGCGGIAGYYAVFVFGRK